ncbi:hypothetical protein WN944_009961 [Citrus x changshan-huyou]|uniref:Uncharacterized protein n=1 Tax=Citrus x changshan-huyou TaxID=2935761 RepID=A0AAP0R085_9ROSI
MVRGGRKPTRTGSGPDPACAVWVKPRPHEWKKWIRALIFNAQLLPGTGPVTVPRTRNPNPGTSLRLSTTHRHRCSVDRASPSTNLLPSSVNSISPRKAQPSRHRLTELFTVGSSSQRHTGSHHATASAIIDATSPTQAHNHDSRTSFDPNVLRSLIARMVVMHELPLTFVEYKGFREMMAHANPVVKPMSRNTLKKEILKLYHIENVKTLNLLEKNHGRVAITTDLWTASNQKKRYMVVTAHFIDNS